MEQEILRCTICNRSVGTSVKGLSSHIVQKHPNRTRTNTNVATAFENINNNICTFVNESNVDESMSFHSDIQTSNTETRNTVNSSESISRTRSESSNTENRDIHRRKRVRTNDKGDDSHYTHFSTSTLKNNDRNQHTQETNENNYYQFGCGEGESDDDDDDEESDDDEEEDDDDDEEKEDDDDDVEDDEDVEENNDNVEGVHDAENNNNNIGTHTNNVPNPFDTGNVEQPNYEEFDTCDTICFQLLSILNKANCPLYLYDQIVDWTYNSYVQYPNLFNHKKLQSRDKLISKLVKNYSLQGCYQQKTEIKLKNCGVDVPVCRVLNPLSSIKSILHQISKYDSKFMNYTNNDNILEMPLKPHEIKEVTELHTGYWYSATFYKMFTDYDYSSNRDNVSRNIGYENAFLLPVIIQLDELCVDSAMKIPMEPVLIGLGLPKRKIRNIPYVWRSLGFIPTLTKIKQHDCLKKPREKLEEYNQVLEYIMEPLAQLQEYPFTWTFKVDGSVYEVKCYIQVQFVMGDCKGLDKTVGRFGNYNCRGLCRICDIRNENCDIPSTTFNYHSPNRINTAGDKQLKKWSIHKMENRGFGKIQFGFLGTGNAYMATPNAPLHQFREKGVIHRAFTEFYKAFNSYKVHSSNNNRNKKQTVYDLFLKRLQKVSKICSRMSRKQYPRLKFNNIDPQKSACCGDDNIGLLLLTFITLFTSCSYDDEYFVSDRERSKIYRDYTLLFHDLLLVYRWLLDKKRQVTEKHMMFHQTFVQLFMKRLITVVNRQEKNGMRLPKVHQVMHIMLWDFMNGVWINLDESLVEVNVRSLGKVPAQRIQKGRDTMNYQVGVRQVENLAIRIFDKSAITPRSDFLDDDRYDSEVPYLQLPSDVTEDGQFVSTFSNSKGRFSVEYDNTSETLELKKHPKKNGIINIESYWDQLMITYMKKELDDELQNNSDMNKIEIFFCTEIKINEILYRVDPNYYNGGKWQDWVQVKYDMSQENDTQKKYQIWPARLEAILVSIDGTEKVSEVHFIVREVKNDCNDETDRNNQRYKWNNNTSICIKYELDEKFKKVDISSLCGTILMIPDGEDNSSDKFFLKIAYPNQWSKSITKVKEYSIAQQQVEASFERKQQIYNRDFMISQPSYLKDIRFYISRNGKFNENEHNNE